MKKAKPCVAPVICQSNGSKKGMQLEKITEKVVEDNRIITAPAKREVNIIWAKRDCRVETLRY